MTPLCRLLISSLPEKLVEAIDNSGGCNCKSCYAEWVNRRDSFIALRQYFREPAFFETKPQHQRLVWHLVRLLPILTPDQRTIIDDMRQLEASADTWGPQETLQYVKNLQDLGDFLVANDCIPKRMVSDIISGVEESVKEYTSPGDPHIIASLLLLASLVSQQSQETTALSLPAHNEMEVAASEVQTAEVKEEKRLEGNETMSNDNAKVVNVQDVLRAIAGEGGDVFKNPVVVREGEKIILPKGMNCDTAIEALTRQKKEEDRVVGIDEPTDAYLFEGLFAFQQALSKKFGWVDHVPTPGFFKSNPPTAISIDVGVGKTARVFWGRIEVPAIEGYLETSYNIKEGRLLFSIRGQVKQRSRETVSELAELTKEFVRNASIYKGQALKLRFPEEDADVDPNDCPKFIDTSVVDTNQLVFSKELHAEIKTALFNPVEKTAMCRKNGISLKRGTLLSGPYGVGKSLAATVLSRKCTDNGWTFIYLENAKDITKALLMARQYQPAVIFAEDIDKVVQGQRDAEMDKILNTLDGVDTKFSEVMVVFTTNHMDHINEAMRRAKRLDYVINVTPPDPDAVRRLILQYTRGHLAPNAELSAVGKLLAGQIPATIQEVCERAQLTAVGHSEGDDAPLVLTDADLEEAARGMLTQIEMLKVKPPKEYSNDVEKAAEIIVAGLGGTLLKSNGSARAVAPALPGQTQ